MKAMKTHRIKFFGQVGVIGTLAAFGLIAISGEPDESLSAVAWISTFGCQMAVCAMSWISAWLLCRRWDISRKLRMIEYRQKRQMKAL